MPLPIDHARLPKPGDVLGDKYRLLCVLGSGGMGVVFGATHLITQKRVAIKWLAAEPVSSDTTRRFMREARLAGEFQHPNVVQIYDLGEANGSFYMVMEWLEGESLAARLERVKRLSFQDTIACLIPCMHAIQRAHEAGIIHRDLKPANIFLCQATADLPATAKVLDFGISKRITDTPIAGSFVTRTGMLIGTPHYLSPEQLRARPVDPRTDIYGFGVVLYETLAGVLPFTADNFGDLVVQISTSTPRSLRDLVPDLPLGVEQVVARAMAREPDQRYQTLYDLIASLEAIDPAPLTAATLRQKAPLSSPSLNPISTSRPIAQAPRTLSLRARYALAAAAGAIVVAVGMRLSQGKPATDAEPAAPAQPPSAAVQLPPRAPASARLAGSADERARHAASDAAQGQPSLPKDASQSQRSPSLAAQEPRSSARPALETTRAPVNVAKPVAKPVAQSVAKPVAPARARSKAAKPAVQSSPAPDAGVRPSARTAPAAQPAAAPTRGARRDPERLDHNPLHMDIQ